MNGIIDTGGGLRGAFGAGVLDWCNHNKVTFDYCIGVSAGSGNMVSYLAEQPGRNLRFYIDYSLRSEYMSFNNMIRKKSYLDVDYIYSGLTNEDGEDPLDFDKFSESGAAFKVVATDADTGLPVYFDKSDFTRNDYFPLQASSSIPVVCRPYERGGRKYLDGGISDPIPLERARKDGCSKTVVILTRPKDYIRNPKRDIAFANILRLTHRKAANALRYRYLTYNLELQDLLQAEAEGNVLVLAPDNIDGISTLTKNPDLLQRLYWKGYIEAEKISKFI